MDIRRPARNPVEDLLVACGVIALIIGVPLAIFGAIQAQSDVALGQALGLASSPNYTMTWVGILLAIAGILTVVVALVMRSARLRV
jgi:hypothetical protein